MFKETRETLDSSVQIRIDFSLPIPSARCVAVPTAVIGRRGAAASPERPARRPTYNASHTKSPRLECVSRVEQLLFPVFQPWKLYLTIHPAVHPDQQSCFVCAGAMSMQEFHNRCCSSPKWSRPRDPFLYASELRTSSRKNCRQ